MIRIYDEVLMFREKAVGKWAGPYRVHRFLQNDKVLELSTWDRLIIASADKIKLYKSRNSLITTTISTGDDKNEVDALIELDKIRDPFKPSKESREISSITMLSLLTHSL